ncbi:histidine kinase [Actinokineospora auranticolor]|uniref:histidine kinase n=1 Tax=Actinokineospora auranticolor TaxID=155976 RepID=A0A2S6GGB1_9PSEU|nr:histidine kinase [Actinokineospora auranticolor]PPK64243.1 signal transduction histidine kinase [Actinokineospora auranticolor]
MARAGRSGAWQIVLAFGLGVVLYFIDFPRLVHVDLLPGPMWARLLILTALSALQLLRHRAPVRAFLIGLVLLNLNLAMGLDLAVLLAFGDLLYAAVLYGSRRASRALIALVWVYLAAVVVIAVIIAPDVRTALLIMLSTCPLPALPAWWALNVRQQREIAIAERARADGLARIAELDRSAAVTAERAAMARDLHDVVAGHISAIAIQTEALLTMAPGADPERARTVLRSVRENSLASLHEMRAMIGVLRSPDGTQDGLTAPARLRQLDQLVRSARAAGLEVDVAVSGVDDLPAAVDLSAYRITQEALTNALKHAPGAKVRVDVRRERAAVVVEVDSDGRAALPNPVGAGLITMTERAESVGGTLVAGPRPTGWRVRAELPLEER